MTPDQGDNRILPEDVPGEDDVLTALPDGPEDDSVDDSEDDEDEDEEEGDGTASLALDVPEPAQAMAANAALAKGGKDKGAKGKGKKKGKAADKGAIDIALGEDMIGLEAEPEDDEEELEAQESSAFDNDEITDIDADDIDPLMMVLGGQEKPWENEKLSLVERMMIPGYQRDLDALKQDQDDGAEKPARGKKAATATIAAAVVAATAQAHQAAQHAKQQGGGPGMGGVARGPQRAAEQEQPKPDTKTENRRIETQRIEAARVEAQQQNKTETTARQARQNAEDVTLRHIATGLAATMAAQAGRTAFDDSRAAIGRSDGQLGMDMLEMMDMLDRQQNNNDGPDNDGPDNNGVVWTPGTGAAGGFTQTMGMIYASLEAQNLLSASPYRQAGWDEKRLEQKENSKDVTIAAPAPEPKAPAAELNFQRDFQINLGPGGM